MRRRLLLWLAFAALVYAVLLLAGCAPIVMDPPRDMIGEFCRPMCARLDFLPGWHECARDGDRDYCTGQVYVDGRWQPSSARLP